MNNKRNGLALILIILAAFLAGMVSRDLVISTMAQTGARTPTTFPPNQPQSTQPIRRGQKQQLEYRVVEAADAGNLEDKIRPLAQQGFEVINISVASPALSGYFPIYAAVLQRQIN